MGSNVIRNHTVPLTYAELQAEIAKWEQVDFGARAHMDLPEGYSNPDAEVDELYVAGVYQNHIDAVYRRAGGNAHFRSRYIV